LLPSCVQDRQRHRRRQKHSKLCWSHTCGHCRRRNVMPVWGTANLWHNLMTAVSWHDNVYLLWCRLCSWRVTFCTYYTWRRFVECVHWMLLCEPICPRRSVSSQNWESNHDTLYWLLWGAFPFYSEIGKPCSSSRVPSFLVILYV